MAWRYYAQSVWGSTQSYKGNLCIAGVTIFNAKNCNSTLRAYVGYNAGYATNYGNYYINLTKCYYDPK